MKSKTKTYATYQRREGGVIMDPVSMTVPDMSFTIQDILSRQKANLPFPQRKPVFTEDILITDDLDLVQVKEKREAILNEIQNLENKEKSKKQQQQLQKQKDLLKKEIEDEQKQKSEKGEGGTTTTQTLKNQ